MYVLSTIVVTDLLEYISEQEAIVVLGWVGLDWIGGTARKTTGRYSRCDCDTNETVTFMQVLILYRQLYPESNDVELFSLHATDTCEKKKRKEMLLCIYYPVFLP